MTVEDVDAFVRADAGVGGVGECESCDSVRGARAPVEEEAGRAWPVSVLRGRASTCQSGSQQQQLPLYYIG